MILYKDLTSLSAFKKLKLLSPTIISQDLIEKKIKKMVIKSLSGYEFYFSGKPINLNHLNTLQNLAKEAQVIEKYKRILSGENVNTTEERQVLHHYTRGDVGFYSNPNAYSFFKKELDRIIQFNNSLNEGQIKGTTGLPFKNIVQIGIGGSSLGPKALYLALKGEAQKRGTHTRRAYFISNVDPDDAFSVLQDINLEETLFISVSKSGKTQETLANENLIRNLLTTKNLNPSQHFLLVRCSSHAHEVNVSHYLDIFYIQPSIGGRYSSTSAVGSVVLTFSLGEKIVKELLQGSHTVDKECLNPSIIQNAPMLDALLGIYERNVLGYCATAILPYSQVMSHFTDHMRQLDMESNGKSVNVHSQFIDYATGPIVFGESGTNGQHSFYQFLHQSRDVIPLQFIGFTNNQNSLSQENNIKLKANLIAQMMAFTYGQQDKDPSKTFIGNRPNSLILAPQLTPSIMGALLSHYENKIMFQGFLWNINSFDQAGVQLGKTLTSQILQKDPSRSKAMQAWEKIVQL